MSRIVLKVLERQMDELERTAGFGKVAAAEAAVKTAMCLIRDLHARIEALEKGLSMQLAVDVMARVEVLEGKLNDA